MKLFKWILVVTLFMVSNWANANVVYTFNTLVGAGNASGSITTDGTIGTLSSSNILDWDIQLNPSLGSSFTLLGPLSGSNSAFQTSGGLVGDLTNLTFDFSSSFYALFQNPNIGSSMNYLCFAGQLCGGYGNAINMATSQFGSDTSPMSGIQVVATSAINNVPEPATLALMGLGLAGLGFSRRKGKKQ